MPQGIEHHLVCQRLVQADAAHEAAAAHVGYEGKLGQALAQVRPHLVDMIEEALLDHNPGRRVRRRAGERATTEGRAVHTRLHERGELGLGCKTTHGNAICDALCHRHDVGLDTVCLEGEVRARTAESRLDLVNDEQHVALACHLAGGLQVFERAGPDA